MNSLAQLSSREYLLAISGKIDDRASFCRTEIIDACLDRLQANAEHCLDYLGSDGLSFRATLRASLPRIRQPGLWSFITTIGHTMLPLLKNRESTLVLPLYSPRLLPSSAKSTFGTQAKLSIILANVISAGWIRASMKATILSVHPQRTTALGMSHAASDVHFHRDPCCTEVELPPKRIISVTALKDLHLSAVPDTNNHELIGGFLRMNLSQGVLHGV